MENQIRKVKDQQDLISRKVSTQKSKDVGRDFKKAKGLYLPHSFLRSVLGIRQ